MFWYIASFCSLNSYFHKPWTWSLHSFFVSFYSYLSSFHSNQIVCFILIKHSGYYERWALKKDCHWTDKLVIFQSAWKQGRVRVGKVSFRDNVFWRQLQQCWNPFLSSISSFFFFNSIANIKSGKLKGTYPGYILLLSSWTGEESWIFQRSLCLVYLYCSGAITACNYSYWKNLPLYQVFQLIFFHSRFMPTVSRCLTICTLPWKTTSKENNK